jgi:hypothetical protein
VRQAPWTLCFAWMIMRRPVRARDDGCWGLAAGPCLERYEAAFRENEIDETVLLSLTAEDLKDLGVGIIGHRRKLLDAISGVSPNSDSLPSPFSQGAGVP